MRLEPPTWPRDLLNGNISLRHPPLPFSPHPHTPHRPHTPNIPRAEHIALHTARRARGRTRRAHDLAPHAPLPHIRTRRMRRAETTTNCVSPRGRGAHTSRQRYRTMDLATTSATEGIGLNHFSRAMRRPLGDKAAGAPTIVAKLGVTSTESHAARDTVSRHRGNRPRRRQRSTARYACAPVPRGRRAKGKGDFPSPELTNITIARLSDTSATQGTTISALGSFRTP